MNIMSKAMVYVALVLCSAMVIAAPKVLYFPADYNASSGRPTDVTNQAGFAPICDVPGDIYSVRLQGLDYVRSFAAASTCTVTTTTNSFNPQVEYVFLIDDTAALSTYLQTQMRQKNILQTLDGRQVIKPSVLDFAADDTRQGFKILVVGETVFENVSMDETGWFAALNARFAADQLIAGGQNTGGTDDDIWFAAHGMYFNSAGQWLKDISLEKVVEFFEKQQQQLENAIGLSAPIPSQPAAALPSPPPLPSRQLNDYMTLCHNNLVPLPPVWNPTSATNQWQRRGSLSNPFIAPGLTKVEIWTYSSNSPEGICFALPRMEPRGDINRDIQALGVICQSKRSGKACFWDNVERPAGNVSSGQTDENIRRPDSQPKITGVDTRDLDPVNMSDGYNLKENCTVCHRGSNVFLVRSGTPLETYSQDPDVRYQPLSGTPRSPNWANPVSTLHTAVEAASSGTECTMCHDSNNEIAEVTRDYCMGVICNSIGANMPAVGDPADWANNYLNEVRVISDRCCSLNVDLGLTDAVDGKGTPLNSSSCSAPATLACPDSDADGVKNIFDLCPDTTFGENVNAGGCSSTQTP